jgi:hypothetical protein
LVGFKESANQLFVHERLQPMSVGNVDK